MSYHGLPLDDDDQRNRAIAALLVPARKPIEIDYSKEILGELKKMNELMKVQISLLKEIRDTTKTLSLQARPQAANPQPALNQAQAH